MGLEMSSQPSANPSMTRSWTQNAQAFEGRPKFAQSRSLDLDSTFAASKVLRSQSSMPGVATGGTTPTTTAGFSDYNFYPDRFVGMELKKVPEEEGVPQQQQQQHLRVPPPPHATSHDENESSSSSDEASTEGGTSPTNLKFDPPVPSISKYSFRIRIQVKSSFMGILKRTFSASDDTHHPPPVAASTTTTDFPTARPQSSRPPQRQRSNSLSSSFYYFDFSFLPEKDPRCTKDEEERKRRVRNASQGEDDRHPILKQASSQPPPSTLQLHPPLPMQQRQQPPRPKRKMSSPTQFSFFDYSMIPDKMGAPKPASAASSTATTKPRDMAVKK